MGYKSTFNLNVYCRGSKVGKDGLAPLELSININQKRVFINLPYRAEPDEFNRKRRPKELQEYVNVTMGNINSILLEMAKNDIPVTADGLREYIRSGGFKAYSVNDLFNDYLSIMKKRIGVDLTQSGYRKYELTKELFLKEFDGSKEVTAITPAVVQDFYCTLKSKYKTASSASYIAKLKTIVQFGIDNNRIKINPFQNLKVQREKKQIDYLTEEEINKLINTEIENESLAAVKDAFILQIFSGLSYIDLEHLCKEDIKIREDGTHYIKKDRWKTKVQYTTVILPEGIEVLKKHNYQLKVISNQKMNIYLKQVMTLCGINHNLTTHLGRKTYGHILLNKGIRLETVAKALGHSNTKTTAKYYAELTTDTVINEIENMIKS